MYLARFDAEGMMLAQGAVAVQGDPGNDAGAGLWSAQLDSLADALKTLAYQCLAVRLQASPEGKFQRLVAVTVTADHTDTLCTWIASFTRFDRVVDGAVIIPADRVQFDALLGAVPRLSSCLLPEALQTAEGAWLAVPSRIQPFLADLFEEASLFGHELTYQAHLIPSEGKVEDLRSARKNLLRLEHTAGIPRVLLEAQRARVSEFARATTEVEEFVAVDTPEAAAWLRKALSRRLAANWAASGVAAPEVVVEAVRYRDVLSGALHQALVVAQAPATVDRRTAAAADDTFQHQLLTWRPRSPLVTMPAGRSGADIGQPSLALRPIKTRWTVVPYEGDESFLCISYSHADAERLTNLVAQIADTGWRLWYDRGIPGGVEWDALIEQRLATCCGVVTFLSAAAVTSRHVRRELKFADAVGKPIVGILVEPVTLQHGLGMMFAPYQLLDAGVESFKADLCRTLTRWPGKSIS